MCISEALWRQELMLLNSHTMLEWVKHDLMKLSGKALRMKKLKLKRMYTSQTARNEVRTILTNYITCGLQERPTRSFGNQVGMPSVSLWLH